MTRRPRERGAVAVITAAMTFVLILVAALAVDLGMQRVVRADAQAVADVAALDMARELGTLTPGSHEWRDALEESLTRNDRNLGQRPAAAPGPEWVCTPEICALAEAGWVDADHAFLVGAVPAGERSAVRVRTAAEIDFALAGGSGGANREAVAAVSDPAVCFAVGSKLLSLDTSGSALSPLLEEILGVHIGLDAASYNGLVDLRNVSVDLIHLGPVLSAEVGAATVDQLLAAEIGLVGFLEATAEAMAAGGADAVRVSALRSLAVAIEELALSSAALEPIRLGEVLELDTATPLAGLSGEVDALTLVTVGILAANRANAVDLTVAVPNLVSAKATVVEPPKIACGGVGAVAESAQIMVATKLELPASSTPPMVGGAVDLQLLIASGTGTLAALGCAPEEVVIDVVTSGARVLGPPTAPPQVRLSVGLSPILDLFGPASSLNVLRNTIEGLLRTLGASQVNLDVKVAGEVASSSGRLTFAYPAAPALPADQSVPASGVHGMLQLSLAPPSAVTITSTGVAGALGSRLGDVIGGLTSAVVNPVVSALNASLLTPLVSSVQDLLGARLGVTDVDVQSRPDCRAVELVG